MAKENRIKSCPECEKTFEVNRLDQKFCNRKCRNRLNNRRVRATNYDTKSIDNILHQNYKILKDSEYLDISKSDLDSLGFNFGFVTHFKLTKKGKHHYFLYDHGYYFGQDNTIHIIEPKNT